jgi:hypothetical protein
MINYNVGWSDPRASYQTVEVGPVYTYEVKQETKGIRHYFKPTYAVVKVSRYAISQTRTARGWEPYKETIYSGLSLETAEGYVKLLTQPED